METGTKNILFCASLAVFILFLVFGCGTRKVSNEKHILKYDSLKVENSLILSQNLRFSNIGKVKPFDSSKPMIIDGKEYFNVSFEFDKSQISDLEIKSNDNLSYNSGESENNNKKVEKKDNSNLWIGLFFVLALFLFLYLKTKKPIS